jgi:hypothetical protein
MLEPFTLQPRRWEGGGPDGGCQIVVDNSGTTLCALSARGLPLLVVSMLGRASDA